MMKKLFFILLGIVSCTFSLQGAGEKKVQDKDDPYVHLTSFMKSMMLIRKNYADQDQVTYEKLFRGALRGMLQELDPYSRYEDPQKYEKTVEDTKGSFAGIGVVISSNGAGFPRVVSVMKGSPAEKNGMKAGDLLSEAAGKNLQNSSSAECVSLIKGKAGTKVTVVYIRAADGTKHKVDLTRAVIEVSSVKNVSLLPGTKTGYIRISQFTQTTVRDLDKALENLARKGMDGVILDLRNNPGGLLDAGIGTASRFLKKGTLLLSVEGRASGIKKYYAQKCRNYPDLPLVLLVNGSSASASEIVSGALKDLGRAVLVGTKTFGKGSVQTIVNLPGKGALRITTAKYFTPKRQQIHGKGISPNIVVPVTMAENFAVFSGLNLHEDQAPKKTSGKYTDRQLIRAEEILKGILIYRNSMHQ